MEGIEAARKTCDETNLKTESEVVDFLKSQGLAVYEADVDTFANEVLAKYLENDISKSWDKDLFEKVKAMG